jgi:undecaprenyl diphosphate synthase
MLMAIPQCVGIILDGNRRWAKERGLPTLEGHRRGKDNIETIALAARDLGIKHLVVYAFSTENWKRTEDEVGYLMRLFEEVARTSVGRLHDEHIAVRFIGQRERFTRGLREAMENAEKNNPENPKLTLWVCISYGGRAEIVSAAKEAAAEGEITEDSLAKHLWSAGMPEPDIIIRPGGERRISNFLLWQSAYSEFFFIDTKWPDFTKVELEKILEEFGARERRRGK